MSTVPTVLIAPAALTTARRRSIWRAPLQSSEGRIGLVLAVIVLLIVVLGPVVSPYSPNEVAAGAPTQGPSAAHLLGTDSLGRDVLSRFLWGGRSVIVVPVLAVTFGYVIGVLLGMLGGYSRGIVSIVIARVLDLGLAIPTLLIMLTVISSLGHSAVVLVVAYGILHCAAPGRMVRAATQSVIANDYVAAARSRGERVWNILGREVLPNIAGPVIADYAVRITWGILFINTLSYLGLGAQPPSSNWGLMISEGQSYLRLNPWATLAPAAGIAAMAVSFNLIALSLSRYITRESAGRGASA